MAAQRSPKKLLSPGAHARPVARSDAAVAGRGRCGWLSARFLTASLLLLSVHACGALPGDEPQTSRGLAADGQVSPARGSQAGDLRAAGPATLDVASRAGSDPALPWWIWGDASAGGEERLLLARVFALDSAPVRATLIVSADNHAEVLLDGARVLSVDEWIRPEFVELEQAALTAGEHVLLLRCRNDGGPAGAVAALTLEFADGHVQQLLSDDGWRWAADDGALDVEAARDPAVLAGWPAATALAPLGEGPWGADVRDRFIQAEARALRQLLAIDVSLPPGFVLETVHDVVPGEGSWVGLCLMPDGRLLVSDESDAGLFVVDPDAAAGARVERLDIDLDGTQGMAYWRGDLYALASGHGSTPTGLYRATDSDADGLPDRVELLTALTGSGDHGWHSLVPTPDGEALIVVAGNNTVPPELAASRVPPVWGEDQLLPRLPDANGFMTSALAPGGCVYRVDPLTAEWELLSIGYRNPFDAAFHTSGALFTFDADMEWDLNLPWYRPTRVCEVVSGSDYGWRNGSGKWPPRWPDTLPPVVEVGPGSPVGVAFGTGSDFPGVWDDALFLADWSYGRVFAAWVEPDGAGWTGAVEPFLTGRPFPVCDLLVRPQDGCLYMVTGGRGIAGALYRVRWVGDDSAATPVAPDGVDGRRAVSSSTETWAHLRREMEALHGQPGTDVDLERILQTLGTGDRWQWHATRVALEWQPLERWREQALADLPPWASVDALLALVRVAARDPAHRDRPVAGAADRLLPGGQRGVPHVEAASLRRQVVEALLRIVEAPRGARRTPPGRWTVGELGGPAGPIWTSWLRVLSLCIVRLGAPDADQREALLQVLEPRWPDGLAPGERDADAWRGQVGVLDIDLARLLVALQAPWLAARAVPLLAELPTQEEQLALADALTHLRAGWSPALRAEFLAWFDRAAGYAGGSSFAGTLRLVEQNALDALLDALPDDQREALLAARPERTPPPSPLAALGAAFAGRDTHDWTLDELLPVVSADGPRDLERGRQLFGAAGCFACHRRDGNGGVVGPDLTGAGGRFSPRDVLDAVLDPSAVVSDLYRRTILELADGRVISGQIVNLVGDQLMVCEDMFRPGDLTWLSVDDIVEQRSSTLSPMPEGLVAPLTADEIADLLAWLLQPAAR